MSDQDDIKTLIPVVCPKCNHTSVIEFTIQANLLDETTAAEILKGNQPEPHHHESEEEA